MSNNNEQILKEIDEMLMENRVYMNCGYGTTSITVQKHFRNNNILLGKIKTILNSSDKNYNQGLKDAWDLARKIGGTYGDHYTLNDIEDIFNTYSSLKVFNDYQTYESVMTKIEEYEKKREREKELSELMPGDVIEYGYGPAILLCDNKLEGCYWVLTKYCDCPQHLSYEIFKTKIRKTGEHVDIAGLFEGLGK